MAAKKQAESTDRSWSDFIFSEKHVARYRENWQEQADRTFDQWLVKARAWVRDQTDIRWGSVAAPTIIDAFTGLAMIGLYCDGNEAGVYIRGTGEWARCKPERGYQGVRRQAGRAGIDVIAKTVRKGDDFDYDEAQGWVKHKRAVFFGEEGEPVGFYAIARRFDLKGVPRVITLSVEEAKKRIPRNAKPSGPWNTWFEEMGEKSAILKLGKHLYLGDEMEAALAASGAMLGDGWGLALEEKAEDVNQPPSHPPQTLKDKVRAQAERAAQDAAAEAPQVPEAPPSDEPPVEEYDGPPLDDDGPI